MAVQTPSYWAEERYQPLIEVETAYGNKVKIPERYLPLWKMAQAGKKTTIQHYEQAIADGSYDKPTKRAKFAIDLRKVFVEKYHE